MKTPIAGRADANNACPVCSTHSKGCSWTDDGLHLCRVSQPAVPSDWRTIPPSPDSAGFYHYRHNDDNTRPDRNGTARQSAQQSAAKKPRKPSKPRVDWAASACRYADALRDIDRAELACKLNLPVAALAALPLLGTSGQDSCGATFTFPEHDGSEKIIGISQRIPAAAGLPDSKKEITGSRRGLTILHGWRERPGPLFVAEGPTDTLALAAAGLNAVGRPSNCTGAEMLAVLLRELPANIEIVIVGENDRKPDGSWPGRDGALSVAAKLSDLLNLRPVRVAMPPPPAKDVREWLTAPARSETTWQQRGEVLAALLLSPLSAPPPPTPEEEAAREQARETVPEEDDDPHKLARECRTRIERGVPESLRYWRSDWYHWRAGAYEKLGKEEVQSSITHTVKSQADQLVKIRMDAWRLMDPDKRKEPPKAFRVSTRLLGDVLNALASMCILPSRIDTPGWVQAMPEGVSPDSDFIPCENGILVVPRNGAAPDLKLLPHSPDYFAFQKLSFPYSMSTPATVAWHKFLAELWPTADGDDAELAKGCIDALQEWMGYLLTSDTSLQKILMFVGLPRSGKGTVLRIISHLAGKESCSSPSLSTLAGPFGLAGLMGKSIAFIADARISHKTDTAQAVECLLRISGEDGVSINRKNKDEISVTLPVRFVIATNELPRFSDPSGALTSRFIVIPFEESFLGKENTNLFDQLEVESAGIFLWALEGLRRLRTAKKFSVPEASKEQVGEWEELVSTIKAFVDGNLEFGTKYAVSSDELFTAWQVWCAEYGYRAGDIRNFSNRLRAVLGSKKIRRERDGSGERKWFYTGFRLDPERSRPINSASPTNTLGRNDGTLGRRADPHEEMADEMERRYK